MTFILGISKDLSCSSSTPRWRKDIEGCIEFLSDSMRPFHWPMTYLKVKNLDYYQHYKDRDPKWIKLYYSILDDELFMMLDEIDRCRYMTCLILASRTGNKIPHDPSCLKKLMRLDKPPDLSHLISLGFLIPCGESRQMLDTVYTNAPRPNQPLLSSPLLHPPNLEGEKIVKKRGNGPDSETPIPDDWVPNESHKKLAAARNLEVALEAAHFRGRATELEWRTSRWDQKFTNWMLQEVKFRQRRPS